MNLEQELLDLKYREQTVTIRDLFPRADSAKIAELFSPLRTEDPHKTIFDVAMALSDGGYTSLLQEHGFWDPKCATFSGHCHQCTPALGAVLKILGFDVEYLECYRIQDHIEQTGKIVQVPPTEEPNLDMRAEFCSIARIPYCCLEIFVGDVPFYVTGKHIKRDPVSNEPHALLTPVCYRDNLGIFNHQDDLTKSGIYVARVRPQKNPDSINFAERVIWKKQTPRDPAPEYFATFLRMPIGL